MEAWIFSAVATAVCLAGAGLFRLRRRSPRSGLLGRFNFDVAKAREQGFGPV